MKSLTSVSIKNLKPQKDRKEHSDGGCRGLYLVVQPSGVKSWAVRCRVNGKPVKITLGKVVFDDPAEKGKTTPKIGDALTLAAARKLAKDTLLDVAQGVDPQVARREAKEEQERRREDTFRSVAERYMRREAGMRLDAQGNPTFDASKLRTGHERWLMLQRSAFPTLGAKPVAEIRKSDIIKLLDKLADGELKNHEGDVLTGGPVAADRCLALIRKILNWHAERSDDFRPPLLKLKPRREASEQARDRVLNDDELRIIWKVSGEMDGPFPALVRFLLLTAARRAEAAEMKWSEVKDGDWTLPKERNKVKRDLVRPLSKEAEALLAARPKIEGCEYVFTTDGKRPIGGYSKFKKRFDAVLLRQLRKEGPKAEPLPNWTLHDLRRTARTILSRAGVNSDHAERCLGHVLSGVEGIYDRHRYHSEMQTAYEALAAQIERIVNPPAGNVLAFPQPLAEGV